MMLLDNATIAAVLTTRDCIEAQERAFAGTLTGASVCRPRFDTMMPCDRDDAYYRFGSLEGATDGVHAVRLKSDIVTWPTRADGSQSRQKYCMQPGTYCGLVLLFSTANGEPLAILNDGHLQHMRVGASAGVGARLLARPDARRVGLIGSGGMARTALEALVAVRPITEAVVYSRTPANRARFAAEMSAALGIAVTAVDSAREAVQGADILVTTTDSMQPIVEAAWLEPGMHLVQIGTNDLFPDCAERIEIVVRQGSEAFDLPPGPQYRRDLAASRGAFVGGTAEQQARLPTVTRKPRKQGAVPFYTDVISGAAPGRSHAAEITEYRPVGNWGLQFAACGALAYRRARERGLGRELPTEWFVQSIRN